MCLTDPSVSHCNPMSHSGVKYGSLGPLSLEEVVEKLLADTRDNVGVV